MKWINITEAIPKDHNRLYLVYSSGSYHIGSFDKFGKGFKLQGGNFLTYDKDTLYWAELSPPKT